MTAAAVTLVVLLAGLAAPGVAADRSLTLKIGEPRFWTADRLGTQETSLVLPAGGHRLRVAFLQPSHENFFALRLVDPSGKTVAEHTDSYSTEIYAPAPRAGTWTVRISGGLGDGSARLRAKLEAKPKPPPRTPRALLPNLRLLPPYEFTFASSVNLVRDQSLSAVPFASCNPDDIAQFQAIRCLRFSLGPANAGAGPLVLRYVPAQGIVAPGPVYQQVWHTDGTWSERPAGDFEYHKTHAHYHHSGFGSLDLLRVTDTRTGATTPAGRGPKQGYCMVDYLITDWRAVNNEPRGSAPSTCGSIGPTGAVMGLSAGWTDIYTWELDGNYVDFGLNGDGHYIVRSTADALGQVLESDENDNTSYAYLRITGTRIEVLERGRGTGPWDRRKVVVDDGMPLLARIQAVR